MKKEKVLITESYTYDQAKLVQSIGKEGSNQFYYLVGRTMVAEEKNNNGRIYRLRDIENSINYLAACAKNNSPVGGELDHPSHYKIDPYKISHVITDAWMEGNYGFTKMRIVNTDAGKIVQGLLEGGMKLGVSTRGAGYVDEDGYVVDFECLTVDIVITPSGPGCFPTVLRESVEKIENIKETSINTIRVDKTAQQYIFDSVLDFYKKL